MLYRMRIYARIRGTVLCACVRVFVLYMYIARACLYNVHYVHIEHFLYIMYILNIMNISCTLDIH